MGRRREENRTEGKGKRADRSTSSHNLHGQDEEEKVPGQHGGKREKKKKTTKQSTVEKGK